MRRFDRIVFSLAVTWLGLVAACNQAPANSPAPENRSGSLESERAAPETGESDRSEKLLPDEVRQEIDWEASESYRKLPKGDVPERLREVYVDSPVPVLLPNRPDVLETVQPTVGDHWYAANLTVEGRDVTIQGDRVARVADDMEIPEEGRELTDDGYRITQTDGVLTISFSAFGAAYSIDVECAEVDQTGTCTDQSFSLELVNELALLGGRR